MNFYEFEDYKHAIKELMAERRKQFGSRFTFERMAEACGVQKTYLSKILNSSGQLNPDQLFSACEYLKLNSSETDFLLLLRESQLALHPKRMDLLKAKIEKTRGANLKTESAIRVEQEDVLEQNKWEYYTDVDLQLVHLFLTIPAFAEEPERI
jgi:transcriptional regulator with XRE-family HTH domain